MAVRPASPAIKSVCVGEFISGICGAKVLRTSCQLAVSVGISMAGGCDAKLAAVNNKVINTNVSVGQVEAPRSGGGSGSKSTSSNAETAGSSYAEEVKKVLTEKVVTDNPDGLTNKCEALVMMERVFEWEVPVASGTKYTDVPAWCTNVAAFGTTRGIVEGRAVDRLGMETPVTRDEVALMIYRELKLQKYEFKGTSVVEFSDAPLTPWAQEAIEALAKESIIKGFADGSFGGKKNILKQDLAIMLFRHKKANNSYSKVDDSNKI